jgi:hypothetical protein
MKSAYVSGRSWQWSASRDPGDCPVDDAPHNTCTSPDYQSGALVIPVRRPRVLRGTVVGHAVPLAPVEPPPPVEFKADEYRRSLHHPKGRRPKGKP